jgi:iron complex transport system substrate-binding protein/vitamin B12 transport system substrate-binding protein
VLIARIGAGSAPVVDSAGVNHWQAAGLAAARLGRVFMVDADAVFRSGPRLIEAAEPICELIEQSRK